MRLADYSGARGRHRNEPNPVTFQRLNDSPVPKHLRIVWGVRKWYKTQFEQSVCSIPGKKHAGHSTNSLSQKLVLLKTHRRKFAKQVVTGGLKQALERKYRLLFLY